MGKKTKMLLLWITGILFLLVFSYTTSPLFPASYGRDSAFFQLVGAGMTKGYVPYRDFFDMKGPWLFLIQYAGAALWYGKAGIFALQCVNLGAVLYLCGKISEKYFGGRRTAAQVLMTIPFWVILASTMEGGNLTEEWSLLFLFLPLYLALEFVMSGEKEHKASYAFVYGVCFGVIALIRITNAVLICAIVLTVTLHLWMKRRWKNFFWNVLGFLGGVAASFVPPLLYFGNIGQIGNMLYCTFVFGFIYGTEGFAWGTGMLFLVTLLFPLGVLWITKERNPRLWLLLSADTAGMLAVLGMGNSTMHDYMLILPGVMLGIWQLGRTEWRGAKKRGLNRVLAVLIIIICFAYPFYKLIGTGKEVYRQAADRSEWQNARETAECIAQEEKDSVLGYEITMNWYVIADVIPSSKYCGWQEHYMALSPQIESEIGEMFREEPPLWIVCMTGKEIGNKMVLEELNANYKVYQQNEDFVLYKRRAAQNAR